ncbi:MAG: galactose-1-phosphate uridylyltransferase, partial [Candidatus Omnitrophota bacterium]
AVSTAPAYVSDCYLCPGNPRVHGERNPDYKDVFIFDNDHPVVGVRSPDIPAELAEDEIGLYRRARASGIARVVCYDPRHNVTLGQMKLEKAVKVFLAWREQMRNLKATPGIRFVLIFENKGEVVGVSNPHPHCQIYATNFTFRHVERELSSAADYQKEKKRNLFQDVLDAERQAGIRLLAENENAVAFIPFFARYAYEVLIFPKKRHATFITMEDEELRDLASAFQQVIRRYDLLFGFSFPYVLSILQAPVQEGDYSNYHLHLLLQPPLRQPGLQKFLAGPEIGGGNFMADTMPEEKARELQSVNLSQFQEAD